MKMADAFIMYFLYLIIISFPYFILSKKLPSIGYILIYTKKIATQSESKEIFSVNFFTVQMFFQKISKGFFHSHNSFISVLAYLLIKLATYQAAERQTAAFLIKLAF